MNKTVDQKKDILRAADGISLMFQEHKLKAVLYDISRDSLEFRVKGVPKHLAAIMRALYLREGVRRVGAWHDEKQTVIAIWFDEFIS